MLIQKSFFPLLLVVPALLSAQTPNPTYRFHTNLGDIDVVLTPAAAPQTVANFINYVNTGAYVNSIFHRSVPGFVIQAGGFQYQNAAVVATPTNPPVINEFNVTNAKGTIAMAKLGTDPNSATSQWFFNLVDNGATLDGQNGGFTVFGNIANAAGLTVMNRIAALPTVDDSLTVNTAFTNLPLSGGNFVLVTSIQQVPSLTGTGFQSAASFAASTANGISPGELLVIYGQSLGPSTLATLTVNNGVVANSLAGTQVTFNGKAAPVIYTSSGQVSVVAPYNFANLPTVDIAVSYNGASSAALTFPVKPSNPAIFTLNSSGSGDGAIVRPDGSIVSASSPASPGDILVLFGEGYGAPTPGTALPDGTLVGTLLPVPNDPVQMLLIDGQAVTPMYFGGAPSLVNGVLQVNFKVPQLSAGSHQIQIQVGNRISPLGVKLQTK